MSETLKRRLIDQIGDTPTFVAEGSRLTGDLETPGPLVVCGTIRGDGRVGGALRMAANGAMGGRDPRAGRHHRRQDHRQARRRRASSRSARAP